jgi:hypothetical protein
MNYSGLVSIYHIVLGAMYELESIGPTQQRHARGTLHHIKWQPDHC